MEESNLGYTLNQCLFERDWLLPARQSSFTWFKYQLSITQSADENDIYFLGKFLWNNRFMAWPLTNKHYRKHCQLLILQQPAVCFPMKSLTLCFYVLLFPQNILYHCAESSCKVIQWMEIHQLKLHTIFWSSGELNKRLLLSTTCNTFFDHCLWSKLNIPLLVAYCINPKHASHFAGTLIHPHWPYTVIIHMI